MKWFYKLERKYGRYAIHNLMYYIIILYTVGFFIQLFAPGLYDSMLSLKVSAILHGQVWRLFTFIIEPPNSDILFIIFSLYLYYMLGNTLERTWGAFRFNVYFFMGVLFHILAAFIIYFAFGSDYQLSTYYLNMSLFLAFACTYPDMQLMLFFIIPVKIKWLAIVDGLYFAYTIVAGIIFGRPDISTAAFVSLLNFLVFFLITRNKNHITVAQRKQRVVYKSKVAAAQKASRHKCAICGQTEANASLTFRFCSKCEGNYEYCDQHLYTHQHIKKEDL